MTHSSLTSAAPTTTSFPNPEDLAREVIGQSSALGGQLNPVTRRAIKELLQLTNSYYSNLIDGDSAHPIDIEQALTQRCSNDPDQLHLQKIGLAHINCQRAIESRLRINPKLNTADTDFICWIHRSFYENLPVVMRQVKDDKQGVREIIPGEFRQIEVQGPPLENLPTYLDRFATAYTPAKHHGIMPLIATAASHHRLIWLKLFLDGNGLVTRFYTDACFQRLPLEGYGLWNISRGLAKHRNNYLASFSSDNNHQGNNYDERGNLSNKARLSFCRFFLTTCLDEIAFMQNLLSVDNLLTRISGYVAMRGAKLIPGPNPEFKTLKPEATYMLQEVLLRGEMGRGDIIRVSGMTERVGRMLLSQLLNEGLLSSDSPKGVVRLNLPTHVAGHLLPNLYPAKVF